MIPYNPSSFNSNKTILEQILELKNWLKEHPQYEVYYCNDNASLYPFMNTFSLANVPDNTNMDVGDLVVCNNAVYCTVISIDRDNGVFTAGYGVSFKGDPGATGQQGYSLRVSSENYVDDVTAYHRSNLEPSHGTRENDTIIFANGYVGIVTSLGAGATYYVTNRTVSFVGPQGPQGPTGPEGPEGPTGATGPQGVSITNVAIDGNQHLIVTLSDGSSIDAGSVSSGGSFDVITITSQTGNFSASDIVKLQKENTRLIYNNIVYTNAVNNGTTLYYKGTYFGTGYVRYESVFVITISSGYYTRQTAPLTSGTATAGQVLMADGYGSSSWQTPSGGTTLNKYSYTFSGTNFTRLRNIILNAKGKVNAGFYYNNYYGTLSIGKGLSTQQFTTLSGIGMKSDTATSTDLIFLVGDTGNNNFNCITCVNGTFTRTNITSELSIYVEYYNDVEITA